ncbi:tetratricopeptide repeat protein [Sphingomonas sp. AP4-R1]|uniref:tetratricopeptide repeat protein n=1 Tax=Sphingomonas sp. AP4-R1 TaxID=2735134 RepID=UPI00149344C1|nr:tetratricopeptide repeat protein [Sphingomonas sp. AP4-R1]QJU59548.1 tetratricopeptide repeat protein [Sphingomonas sp. AP4-R1]
MFLRPLTIACLLASVATPALAQSADKMAPRVDKLEKEMKAVQRKVFPGGSPAFFEPEIAATPATAAPVQRAPADQAVRDLTGRVEALERELETLTGQIEVNQHKLDVLTQTEAKDRADLDARLKVLEGGAAPAPTLNAPLPIDAAPPRRPGKGTPPRPLPAEPAAAEPAPAPAAAEPAAPSTGDAGEDAYMAGYKLWDQKKFPEAQAALSAMIKKYPKHKRASYARNLLGRAQLDGGTPAMAAQTFYANYQTDPRGERAPDSLFYLGQALTQLKKPADACKAYGELEQVYGTTLAAGLKSKLPAAKKAADCK